MTFSYHEIFYRVKDALGNLTDIYFDDLGNIRQSLDGLSRATRLGNSLPDNVVTTIIAADNTTSTFQYDGRGNAIEVVNPMGQEQRFDYEPTFNNLVEFRDALNHETRFTYDPLGNPLSTKYPDGTTEEFGQDGQGNLTRSLNRRGQLVRYTYDTRGLLTRKTCQMARVSITHMTRSGNLLSATGPTGATVMEYDATDRMVKITYPGGRFLQFVYDAGGRRTRSTDQSGFSVNYRYDTAGRLEELTDGASQRLVLYQYDAAGRLARETRGNGTFSTHEYDAADQLRHLIHRAA